MANGNSLLSCGEFAQKYLDDLECTTEGCKGIGDRRHCGKCEDKLLDMDYAPFTGSFSNNKLAVPLYLYVERTEEQCKAFRNMMCRVCEIPDNDIERAFEKQAKEFMKYYRQELHITLASKTGNFNNVNDILCLAFGALNTLKSLNYSKYKAAEIEDFNN